MVSWWIVAFCAVYDCTVMITWYHFIVLMSVRSVELGHLGFYNQIYSGKVDRTSGSRSNILELVCWHLLCVEVSVKLYIPEYFGTCSRNGYLVNKSEVGSTLAVALIGENVKSEIHA